MTKTYKFYQGGRAPYATDGWYLEKDLITAENDVLFEAGTGLWMSGIEGASFTTSGEVLEGDLVVPLQNGFKMVANPYPTTITLTKIQPIVTGKCNGAIQIQLLNKNGVMTKTYKYYQGGRAPYATDGWYEEKTLITEANDISFEGGTGLWMSGVTDSSVKFVCPITK